MALAHHVATLGRGPGRSRSLTFDEAQDAMTQMLNGDAAPEAIGALLMLLRMKGEEPLEIAGLTTAAAAQVAIAKPDLDWPSYSAGRTRGAPMFLLAAKLVANAGYRVLLHGWNGTDQTVRDGLKTAGIPSAASLDEANHLLDQGNIVYVPLEVLLPPLHGFIALRPVFGLRSCINTVSRMLNPGGARAVVQGVFHPTYRGLQAQSAELMGIENLSVVKGGGGEFERHPGRIVQAHGLRRSQQWISDLPAISDDRRKLVELGVDQNALAAIWAGAQSNAFVADCVTSTTALALDTLGVSDADQMAQDLWQTRQQNLGV